MNGTIARSGLTTLVATAAALGMVAGPASAAGPQAGNGSKYFDGPQITMSLPGDDVVDSAAPVGAFKPVQAGKTVRLTVGFGIGGVKSTYSDLSYRTSLPGSIPDADCDLVDAYSTDGTGGVAHCTATVPAVAAGATRTYSVTFNGKRDGKAFSVTRSVRLYGADVRTTVFVNGQDASGRRVTVPRTGMVTVTYLVKNTSALTATDVQSGPGAGYACTIGTLAPGKQGVCAYRIPASQVDQPLMPYTVDNVYATFSGAIGVFRTDKPTEIVVR